MVKKYSDIDPNAVTGDIDAAIQGETPTMGVSAVSNAAGVTYTAAQLLSRVINRSGAAAVTDTLPTAANLIAAIDNAVVGTGFEFVVMNNNSGTLTIAAGTGVTLAGNTTIATANVRRYLAQVTGAATVTVTGISTGAV